MAWPEWMGLLFTVLVAVAGGSWVGDWLTAHTKRSLDVRVAHVGDVQRAAEALVEYASLVARRSHTSDASLDDDLRRAGNSLEAAVAMIRTHDLGDAVREYVTVGEAFAGGDPDVPESDERTRFRAILAALRMARLSAPKER